MLLLRFANEGGVRSLCTSIKLCEKKSGVDTSNHNEKPNGSKESGPTETPTSIDQKVEKTIIMAKESQEENEKPVKSDTDDGVPTQSRPTVNTEQQKQVKAPTAKSGKESLLDLLGVMKVDVTNKRKVKSVKYRQNYESIPTSKPAAMESTISMFQQATVEASTQR